MTSLYKIPEHDAFPREKKRAKRAFLRAYLSLFVFLVFISLAVTAIQYGVLWLFGIDMGYTILSSHYFTYATQVVVVYLLGFPIFWLLNLGVPKNYIEEKKMGFGSFLLYFMIAMFVMQAGAYIASYISSILYALLPDSGGTGGAVDAFVDGAPIWLILLVVVIIGPFFEELMFRKVLMDRLSIYGNRLAIIVTSVAFGLFHGNLEQFIYATGIGFVLGIVYAKTGRIKYPVFLHMLLNFFGVVSALCTEFCYEKLSSLVETDPNYLSLSTLYSFIPLILTVIQSGLVIAGLVLFIVFLCKKKLFPKRECQIRLSGFTLARCVILNTGAILFVLFCLFEIIIQLLLPFVTAIIQSMG